MFVTDSALCLAITLGTVSWSQFACAMSRPQCKYPHTTPTTHTHMHSKNQWALDSQCTPSRLHNHLCRVQCDDIMMKPPYISIHRTHLLPHPTHRIATALSIEYYNMRRVYTLFVCMHACARVRLLSNRPQASVDFTIIHGITDGLF